VDDACQSGLGTTATGADHVSHLGRSHPAEILEMETWEVAPGRIRESMPKVSLRLRSVDGTFGMLTPCNGLGAVEVGVVYATSNTAVSAISRDRRNLLSGGRAKFLVVRVDPSYYLGAPEVENSVARFMALHQKDVLP
jgi:hypothetical protein